MHTFSYLSSNCPSSVASYHVFYRVLNWTCNNRLPTASLIVLDGVSSFFNACHLYTVAGLHCLYFPVEWIIFIVSVGYFSRATQNFTMLRNSTSPIDVMLFTKWLWATTLKQCWFVENLNNVMIFSGNDVVTFRCWPAFSRYQNYEIW